MSAEERVRELGIALPSGSAPAANYPDVVHSANLMFVSAKGPLAENGKLPKGKLGREFTVKDGYRFSRSVALDLIAAMRSEPGSRSEFLRGGLPVIVKAVVEISEN